MKRALLPLALALTGCAAGGARCDAGPVQSLVGGPADRSREAEILRLTGSRTVLWHTSEAIVTTVRVPGRLIIDTYDLGEGERILRIRCF